MGFLIFGIAVFVVLAGVGLVMIAHVPSTVRPTVGDVLPLIGIAATVALVVTLMIAGIVSFISPAQAAEEMCPGSSSVAQVVGAVETDGGTFLSLTDVPGNGFDQIMLFAARGAVQHIGFSKGCAISNSFVIGAMATKAPPV